MIKYDKLLVYSNSLKQSISCNFCLRYLDEPVKSSCPHLFCKSCIDQVNNVCPVCKCAIEIENVKKITINKNIISLAVNLLNSIEQSKDSLKCNRKRKKVSFTKLSIDNKKQESPLKPKQINFYYKGRLEKCFKEPKECKVLTRDFGVQVEFELESKETTYLKENKPEYYKNCTIVLETPTKQPIENICIENKSTSIIKSAARMESITDLSILKSHRRSFNSITSTSLNETLSIAVQNLKTCYFSTSLLNVDSKSAISCFSKKYDITISDDVGAETTHLIVQTKENELLCSVTTKYLKAIARKLWIISVQWVLKCLESNSILDFVEFEIQGDDIFGNHFGPSRSRISKTSLFEGFEFLCLGRFNDDSITNNEFLELVKLSGAKLVSKAKDFAENTRRVVLYDEKVQKIGEKAASFMLSTAKIQCITLSWFFDSLASYSIRDITLYAIFA